MATIVKRGSRWLARVRMHGTNQAQSFPTEKAAKAWARDVEHHLSHSAQPRGLGPSQTTLALALLDYAHLYSRFKKGCAKEVTRINAYLRVAGLPVLRVKQLVPGQYQLEEVSAAQLKALPAAFAQHRDQRVKQRQQTNKLRAALALTPVGKLTTHAFRELCNAMVSEGLTGGTIRLEFALLRHCFNQAIKEWHWSTLSNPLDGFKLPRANPPRDRRLTAEEATRLDIALDDCRNPWVKPYIGLAIETTMRRSEILLTATWADVHLEQRFIYLRDTKNGAPQKVPLTKRALEILAALPRAAGQEQVFPLTTDALDKAWKRALRRADIHDMHIHDLRHEGTSRLALRLNGNIFLLKQVTGHKSTKMLERYVNVGLNDVLAEFDKTEPPAVVEPPPATGPEPEQVASLPANVVAFKPRDSAVADTLINPARSTS